MAYIEIFLLTILTYFIGSLPISVIFSKILYGIDIREHGNGTSSWRNISGVIGQKQGIYVFILEKTQIVLIPLISILGALHWDWFAKIEYPIFFSLLALAAFAGANFPMFYDIKQGKHFLFAFAGKHVLNVGAVMICVCLGWDMYFIFRNEELFFELIHTGFAVSSAFSETAILLYLYLIATIAVTYYFYQREFETLVAHFIPKKQDFRILRDLGKKRKK